MNNLASAILIQTVKDWKDERNRAEIREFLGSEWFDELSDIAGIDPRVIRKRLEDGTYNRLSLRAAYRQSWNSTGKEDKSRGRDSRNRFFAGADDRKLGHRLGSNAASGCSD